MLPSMFWKKSKEEFIVCKIRNMKNVLPNENKILKYEFTTSKLDKKCRFSEMLLAFVVSTAETPLKTYVNFQFKAFR